MKLKFRKIREEMNDSAVLFKQKEVKETWRWLWWQVCSM